MERITASSVWTEGHVDIKHRDRPWTGDILLELSHVFDDGRREDGWAKTLWVDWLICIYRDGYAVRIPVEPMQTALKKNEKRWKRYEKSTRTKGLHENWETYFVVVPEKVFWRSLFQTFESEAT